MTRQYRVYRKLTDEQVVRLEGLSESDPDLTIVGWVRTPDLIGPLVRFSDGTEKVLNATGYLRDPRAKSHQRKRED